MTIKYLSNAWLLINNLPYKYATLILCIGVDVFVRRLGYFLHKAPSGKLIVKMTGRKIPRLGSRVVDSRGRFVGIVVDIIGPVRAPYAVVKPKNGNVQLKDYEELFTK